MRLCKECNKQINNRTLSCLCRSCACKARNKKYGFNLSGLRAGWKAKKDLMKLRINKSCLKCGKKYEVRKSWDRVNYCSRSCARVGKKLSDEHKLHIWQSAHRGADSKLWKGGITPEDRIQRVSFGKTIRIKVLKRDDYTCQLCGNRGVDLQVDHIQSWSEFENLRFDLNNCRTLCVNCHYKLTFGRQMPKSTKAWGHNILMAGKGSK